MKKLLAILSFFFVSNVVAQTLSLKQRIEEIVVGHDRYKIAVKYSPSGHRIYIPMRKVFRGKILREWVYSDFVFTTQYRALQVIKEWKREEEMDRNLKREEYIRIK